MKQKEKRTCYSSIVQFRNYFLNSPEYKKLKKSSWAREPELVGGLVGTITMTIVYVALIITELFGLDIISTMNPALKLINVYIAFNIALIIIISVFGHGDIWSRNDLTDYERLGNEIDRLIYDIVTRYRDESDVYYFDMEDLDNDIKSIASVLNGMARNFRSFLTMNSQFKEFAKYMRTFENGGCDESAIRESVKDLDSFTIPEFDEIYKFVRAIVLCDIKRIDGAALYEIIPIQDDVDTILKDYAYCIKHSGWLRERLEEYCAKEFSRPIENAKRDYPLITVSFYFEAAGFNQRRIDKLCKKIKKQSLKQSKDSENEKVDWI